MDKKKIDGGYASRKFWMAVCTMLANIGIGAIAAYLKVDATLVSATIIGNLGALTIYCGSNVGAKFVASGIEKQKIVEAKNNE